jgi:hypothetical protein
LCCCCAAAAAAVVVVVAVALSLRGGGEDDEEEEEGDVLEKLRYGREEERARSDEGSPLEQEIELGSRRGLPLLVVMRKFLAEDGGILK